MQSPRPGTPTDAQGEPIDPAAASLPPESGTQESIDLNLYDQPGHLFRRAQQISVSMFHEILGSDVTPIQYAILRMLHERPRVDQVTLARLTGLDNSTTATTAARLEAKGLLTREVVSTQRRQRSLFLTAQGEEALAAMAPGAHRLNAALLGMLPGEDGEQLMRLLRKFVHLNNAQSRAPLKVDDIQAE
ncbi:MarR family transcriptional regulator [soil metagenome]